MKLEHVLNRRRFMQLAGAVPAARLFKAAPAQAQSPPLQTLRVLTIQTDGIKALLWAQQQSLFAQHGLAIDQINSENSPASLAALIGGSADLAAGSLFTTFSAISHGIGVKFIAPASLYLSDHADSILLVAATSSIKTARDLNGKIVGVNSLNDLYTVATRAWVDSAGGSGASIKALEIPNSEQLAALLNGRVDAGIFKTPFLSPALASGKVRVLGHILDSIAPRFLVSAWIASSDFIAKNGPAVKAFQTVMAQAGRYTNAHQDDTVDLVAKFVGQEPAQVRYSIRATTGVTVSLPELQLPLDFAYRYKLLDKQLDARTMLAPGFPLSPRGST